MNPADPPPIKQPPEGVSPVPDTTPPFGRQAEGRFWWIKHQNRWCVAVLTFRPFDIVPGGPDPRDTMVVTIFSPEGSIASGSEDAARFHAETWGGNSHPPDHRPTGATA